MADDFAPSLLSSMIFPPPPEPVAPQCWDLLNQLESAAIGERQADGSIRVRRADRAGVFLFGPYMHLPQGSYRLTFRVECNQPRFVDQPVLAVEVIVLSRFQQQWRDFTPVELAAGEVSLDFRVSWEHSLENENEGRFEFRFFHLGNADLAVTAVSLKELPLAQSAIPVPRVWRLLGRLEKGWFGIRNRKAQVTVTGSEPQGCLLFGGWPYIRLPLGRYCVRLGVRLALPRRGSDPVLGIEVLGQSRWQTRSDWQAAFGLPARTGLQLAWRDVTADDLAAGTVSFDFDLPSDMAIEAGADAPVEIRVYTLRRAAYRIEALDLVEAKGRDAAPVPPSTWKLRPRSGRRTLAIRNGLRLAADEYGLRIRGAPTAGSAGILHAALRPLGETPPRAAIESQVSAASLAAGEAEIRLTVPAATGSGQGRYALTVSAIGTAPPSISEVELVRLPPEPGGFLAAPHLRPGGRRKIVMVGNCQSETVRQGFLHTESLNRQFEVKYHFVQLPQNLHEFAARDLETCDILLLQDIALWEGFPLKDRIRPGADIIRFPLIRFASPWPFDTWNGPNDKVAFDSEAPNLTFPYLDGLLGRLRREIADPEARFEAYRGLSCRGVVNYRRLHDMEMRRLEAMDKKFEISVGAYILENFRTRRIFHTTARPNWEVFALLMQAVAAWVGAAGQVAVHAGIDAGLRNPQIPVHPKVARDLEIGWADENTRYLNRGREVTWEAYIRDYIAHYG